MIATNKIIVNVGDAFKKNDNPDSRYTVNRVERTVIESGIEQINSIRLRQVAPLVLKEESPEKAQQRAEYSYRPAPVQVVFVNCTVEELFRDYSLVQRRENGERSAIVGEIITAREEKKKMIHNIDGAIKMLKDSQSHDEWQSSCLGPESLHLDIAYLSDVFGRVVMFKSHRWLAKLVYFADRLGKNYNASISSPGFESKEGYGFVTVSTKNRLKAFVVSKLANMLEMLNRNHKFTSGEFIDYPDAAWVEEDSYSLKDLVDNKHRGDDYEFRQQQVGVKVDELLLGLGITPTVQKTLAVKIDTEKLPSKEEVLEQIKLMKEYEEEIVKKAAEEQFGKQKGPTLEPITINPQGE